MENKMKPNRSKNETDRNGDLNGAPDADRHSLEREETGNGTEEIGPVRTTARIGKWNEAERIEARRKREWKGLDRHGTE